MIYKFNFIEKMLLNKDIIAHPFADIGSNVGLAKALGVAVKLKITDQLSSEEKSSAQIAKQCSVSEKGVELLLGCLEAMGYTERNSNGWKFTKRGLKFLDKNSPDSFRYFILYCDWLFNSITSLEDTIVHGKPSKINYDVFGEHEWELYSRAMIEISRTNLKEVAGKIKLPPNTSKLIDLGGSHGQYSIELCKRNNNLSATILDFETVRKYADECIQMHSMQSRVQFQATDFMKEDLPQGNDAALLFNIIHGLTPDQNRLLFGKIFSSLNKGGQLIILDQIKGVGGNSQLSKATTSFMALNLFHQANGNTYSFDEVRAWANDAGFSNQQLRKLHAPGFGLISCEK